jgi:hypothetical protein
VVGGFKDALDFGDGPLTSAGGSDAFVAKLDADGDVIWSRGLGDGLDQQAVQVAVDGDGGVVLAGHIGSATGTGAPHTAFVTWLDPDGEEVLTRPLGAFLSPARITGLALHSSGDAVLTGTFEGTVDFGGGPMTSAGLDDVFVVRYDRQGAVRFGRRFGDSGHQGNAGGVAVDESGNSYVTGGFEGAVDFGEGPVQNQGDLDVFLVKLRPDGSTAWAKAFGDVGHQEAGPIAVTPGGRIAVAGTFEGVIDFGGGPMQSTQGYHFNLFVAALDADGEHRFSKSFGDVDGEEAVGLGFDASGDLIMAGNFAGDLVIGDQGLATHGSWDIFAVRFDRGGTPVASRQFGDNHAQRCKGVAVDPLGQVLLAGAFEGALDFGDGALVSTAGDADAFIARLAF